MKRRKSKYSKYKLAKWSQNQKLEACITYCTLGNLKETAIATGVPYETLKSWRYSDWFKDLMKQIRDEDIQQMDSNLKKVVDKSLKALEDRIDHGDYQYDPKTGKPVRVPIKAAVALKVTTELMTKQDKIREAPDKVEVEKTIDARLAKLSEEFAKFASAKTIEGTYEVISE